MCTASAFRKSNGLGGRSVSEPRNQFTFYRSYFEAIEPLPKKDRSAIILAVCEYGLYEREPKGLSPIAMACFNLIRPTLDSGRKKAANGKQGGKTPKQPGSKTEAKRKQSGREKEGEIEVEIEKEGESDRSKPQAPAFEDFFSAYPRRSYEGDAREAWAELDADVLPAVLESLERWKASANWAQEGGRFIPSAANWLKNGLWRDVPVAAADPSGRRELDAGELEAIAAMMADGTLGG